MGPQGGATLLLRTLIIIIANKTDNAIQFIAYDMVHKEHVYGIIHKSAVERNYLHADAVWPHPVAPHKK